MWGEGVASGLQRRSTTREASVNRPPHGHCVTRPAKGDSASDYVEKERADCPLESHMVSGILMLAKQCIPSF